MMQKEYELQDRVDSLIAQVSLLTALAEQYRDDMRHPPADDSRQRRIKWIDNVLGKKK